MTGRIVVFEDAGWADLRPLTEALPTQALLLGDCSLTERWRRALGGEVIGCEGRAAALEAWRERPSAGRARLGARDEVWVVNAAALPESAWLESAAGGPRPALYVDGDRIAAARLDYGALAPHLGTGDLAPRMRALGVPTFDVRPRWLDRPWRLIEWNAAFLASDLAGQRSRLDGDIHRQAVLLEESRIVIEAGARVDALAVIDGRSGPVRIERGAWIVPHTALYGPCVVGRDTWLLSGLIGASTFGPGCRIQGEVDACIFQGWSNKRHQGFVGHSWIGEWSNLGALTTTSDLKNNYGPVRVHGGGRELDTGVTKLGSMLGAHTKTSIGTLLSTGAMIGTGCNLFGGGVLSPKWLPPFSWWSGAGTVPYRWDAFLKTARTVFSRREREWTASDERILRDAFERSAGERSGAGDAA